MNSISNINLNWLDIYQIFIGSITLIYFSYDKIKQEGWDKVYIFFNSNMINFIKWGKEQSVLFLLEKIRVYIFYMFLFSFAFLIIVVKISILNFLTDIFLYILLFCMFSLISFSSILNFKEESIKLLKFIFIGVMIFIAIFSMAIYLNTPNVIEYIKVISDNKINLSVNELYIINFIALLLVSLAVSFFTYVMYWCLMGVIPTSLLLFIFLVVKSAYFLDSLTKIKRVGTILVFLNIIGLILNGMYN